MPKEKIKVKQKLLPKVKRKWVSKKRRRSSVSYGSWKYLESKDLLLRQEIAAYYASECSQIIDIGGWTNNISKYVDLNKHSVVVVDPLLENKKERNLTYVKGRIVDLDLSIMEEGCCLMALGIDFVTPRLGPRGRIEHTYESADSFIKASSKANMVIVECAVRYQNNGGGKRVIEGLSDFDIRAEVDLNFNKKNHIYENSHAPFLERKIYILDKKGLTR